MDNKDKTIETLRGIAILLVVVGHVIGSASNGGMKVSDDSFLRYVYYTFIDSIQMVLFTILAGWVYALKPIKLGTFNSFISKKFLRILVPMFAVGLSYYLLQYFTPGTNAKSEIANIWKLLFFPYTLFWYLYSLFIVFIIIGLLDLNQQLQTVNRWMIVLLISTLALLARDHFIPFESANYFSYKGVLYLFPSFLFGIGLNRFHTILQNPLITKMALILFFISILIQQLYWFKLLDYVVQKDNIYGLCIGFTASLLLMKLQLQINWLIKLGSFAYSIYLFHAFGTAAGRMIIQKLDFPFITITFALSLMAGIFLPIIADKILSKFHWTSVVFLGRS